MAAAVLIGSAAFVWADDKDKEAEKSCDGGTSDIVECLNKMTEPWDKRLNKAYQEALKEARPEQREQLRAAQRLWIQYRDANCLYHRLGEGSIARIDAADCLLRMTRSRAEELENGLGN
ncbi:MAG: DUF1311 domain-containing protein [Rhizobiales bacterium]|nr:DUF1311 domain-containing protein [Hyphomicrobiales bacterium]